MRTNELQARRADQPPDIDELSSRLSALATRIDTLNGGRREPRPRGAPVAAAVPNAAVRQWPRLPEPADETAEAPAGSRSVEMGDHAQRIADLTAIRDRQSHELQQAREHLESQALAIKSLREHAAERDAEVAGLAHRLLEAEADKVALESQLATALREANNSSVRLAVHEGALNDRASDLASANRLIEELSAGLAAAQVTIATQVADAEDRLHQRYAADRKLLTADFERRIAELQALVAERDAHVAELEEDKSAQGSEIAALRTLIEDCRTELAAAAETIAGKDSHIGFLDTVLKVTRENGEATLKELAAEFDSERAAFARERDELIAKARAASAFQQDIAKLLPRLLEQRVRAA